MYKWLNEWGYKIILMEWNKDGEYVKQTYFLNENFKTAQRIDDSEYTYAWITDKHPLTKQIKNF